MRNFTNIEKLAGRTHYTGYAGGAVFHIYRVGGRWRAHCPSVAEYFYCRTLAEVSAKLTARGTLAY